MSRQDMRSIGYEADRSLRLGLPPYSCLFFAVAPTMHGETGIYRSIMAPQDISQERLRLIELRGKISARALQSPKDRLLTNLLADIDCRLAILDQFDATPPEIKAA